MYIIIVIGVISQLMFFSHIYTHVHVSPQLHPRSHIQSRFNVPEWSWSATSPPLHWQEGRSLSSSAAGSFLPGARLVQWTLDGSQDSNFIAIQIGTMMIFFGAIWCLSCFGWIWNVSSCALISLGYWPQDGRVPELYEPGVRLSLGATSQCFSGRQDVWKLVCNRSSTLKAQLFSLPTGDHVGDLMSFQIATSCVHFYRNFMGGMRFIFIFPEPYLLENPDFLGVTAFSILPLLIPISTDRQIWTRIGGSPYLDDFVIKGLPPKAAVLRHSMGWSLRLPADLVDLVDLEVQAGRSRSIIENQHVLVNGYGSIPINTIFSGMNIHLPAILMFTRGTRFWHTAKSSNMGLGSQALRLLKGIHWNWMGFNQQTWMFYGIFHGT